MPHGICISDVDGIVSHLQRVGRTLLAPSIDPRTGLERLFAHETSEFALNYAFLASIDLETETERFEVVHGSHELLSPGTTVPLSETYCRKTIENPEGTLAVSDAVAEGWQGDPAYETFGLGSYLGTTVTVADEPYGTLCFADTGARDESFQDEEKVLIELYSEWIGFVLTLREEPLARETRVDTIEGRAVSSDAIDSMMNALTDRSRRDVLMTLLGDTTETGIDVLERQLADENARVGLYHRHLPKLADSQYITWDDDAGTISRGPRFSEVQPLVQLLNEYETDSPE
ncbi:hypothetical protein GRX01_08640 [Halobaculum sp. WSA2]|uniref:GAF domain-containing protein n=2 Tax=Halobaculum saliterrae TaxID=2073113 RepID=A0A6B0SXN9_9EURY|nr:hypothetical protein [Halobaculum saliterrae]